MKHKILILILCTSFFLINSCKNDEEPMPTVKVTYVKDVKPIFLNSCTPCHLAGGVNPNKWDDYTQAKNKITTILDRVQRTPGSAGFMPQVGTPLTSAQIATLNKWVTDGLLEN